MAVLVMELVGCERICKVLTRKFIKTEYDSDCKAGSLYIRYEICTVL